MLLFRHLTGAVQTYIGKYMVAVWAKYCIGVLSRPNIGVLPGLESLEPLTVRRPHCSTGPQPVTITPPLERSL